MARINIPLDALTSRLNLQGRFDSVRSQSVANRFANLKPLSEFLALKRLSKPRDFSEIQSRVNYNLSYFSSNYVVVVVMLSIYTLLTHLLLLFVILLSVGGMFGIGRLQGADLDLGFARATSSQLYTGLLVIAVPLGLYASPFTAALWLVGASAVSIFGHAMFLERPIEDSFSGEVNPIALPAHPQSHTLTLCRRFRRSAAHSSPYETGRPPGAPSGGSRRYQDWELRERFEELESDEEDGQGVRLDPNTFALREARRRGFASDDLYFDGYDLGHDLQRRRPVYDDFDSDDDYRQRGMAYQVAVRDKEDALIQSALERIARARAKGKTNVNLSPEEMEALERRRGQQPESSPPLALALASPPATPAKKGKVGSRTSSSTNLAGQKARKKGNGLFGQSSPSPAKSNSKAKVDRKPAAEQALPFAPGTGPPGIMVPGPNGVPVYAPLVYGPPSPEMVRTHSSGSKPRSRSSSKHSRRESTPPDRAESGYMQYPPRYFPPPSGGRPPSSSSNRSLPDEIDWYPPTSRNRSGSNAQYPAYRPADEYDAPLLPAAQGRRNVSGPPDVRFSTLRRAPPSSSPLAPRPLPQHANSEPAGAARKGSGLTREMDRSSRSNSSSSSSDDQGVQVNIVPDASGGGYSISRSPVVPVHDGKRKGGRR